MRRPRLLSFLAVVSLVLGILMVTMATSLVVALTGSRDVFTKAVVDGEVKRTAGLVADKDKQVEARNRADLETISARRADTLWSRRNVLLPLAGLELIVGILLTLGAPRATWGAATRRRWGLSAWQLGAMVGLPIEALEALASRGQSRDLAARISDLTSPFALQVRVMAERALPLMPQLIAALLTASAALYLRGADARSWTEETARVER